MVGSGRHLAEHAIRTKESQAGEKLCAVDEHGLIAVHQRHDVIEDEVMVHHNLGGDLFEFQVFIVVYVDRVFAWDRCLVFARVVLSEGNHVFAVFLVVGY